MVLNAKDAKLNDFATKCENVILFDDENSCGIRDNSIWYKDEKIIDIADCPLVGHHNYQNIMCAIIIAKLCGIENDDIKKAIISFKSLLYSISSIPLKILKFV